MSENWHNPNKPKLKDIKDEDVAYELRELSKYTSLTPEIINIICHGYARICQLERERDEARRIACDNEARHNSMMFDSPKHSDPCAIAESRGWDCFKNAAVVKTLKGVVVSKGKALPPKFELDGDGK